ncbi:MAG: RNA 2'-phosphotransferase [Anaeroplasmataceae bacterium]|nr:RNA 2'-phosphotransferase [Anaeroplasmataceae bacterium]
MNYLRLSKEVSYALRHNPKQYNLTLDSLGYVQIEELLFALNKSTHYPKEITLEDLNKVIEISDKKRLEITEDKIRALYGHSFITKIEKVSALPPEILYHGTSHSTIDKILKEGLKPMNRQYVHLSVDQETAIQVGKRRDEAPVILSIDTKSAIQSGIKFYLGNDKVWLSDPIPIQYIRVLNS